MVQIMDNASREIFAEKRATLGEGCGSMASWRDSVSSGTGGRDIMSTMLRANMSSETDQLSDDELVGQMNTLIFGGLETVSSAICRVLWVLASKPAVQARLRAEIRDAKCAICDNSSNWQVGRMSSLPPAELRVVYAFCDSIRQDTILPLYRPVRSRSGKVLDRIAVPQGTTLIISILSANLDKDVWGEDAREWRPERWLDVHRTQDDCAAEGDEEEGPGEEEWQVPVIKGEMKYPGVYANMMTFLGGGRSCIGFKFAEMELKQVLSTLLSRLHFSLLNIPNEHGQIKQIYWKINPLQVPVVRPPLGDGTSPQVPLWVRMVGEGDFGVEGPAQ
ncbi:hypothetical protein ID866_4951 [Astraeus odoratus]|nr:hypothetical protein ID866_4951 [Astraeus odoratus]